MKRSDKVDADSRRSWTPIPKKPKKRPPSPWKLLRHRLESLSAVNWNGCPQSLAIRSEAKDTTDELFFQPRELGEDYPCALSVSERELGEYTSSRIYMDAATARFSFGKILNLNYNTSTKFT